jgi:hypothetical protein
MFREHFKIRKPGLQYAQCANAEPPTPLGLSSAQEKVVTHASQSLLGLEHTRGLSAVSVFVRA